MQWHHQLLQLFLESDGCQWRYADVNTNPSRESVYELNTSLVGKSVYQNTDVRYEYLVLEGSLKPRFVPPN
jgi:hypothetical protein